MRGVDFSSWQSVVATLVGLALITLIGVGIRLVVMMTIQQRRERMNRQINERLRTLIAAYKVLGGSFTGNLAVDPRHLRDLRRRGEPADNPIADSDPDDESVSGSDRPRRIRDAVEAALSDIILLGTEEHVRLAERAARELVAGRPVHTHELVASLRAFIRAALDLDPVPADLDIPMQGPARPSPAGGRAGAIGKRKAPGAAATGVEAVAAEWARASGSLAWGSDWAPPRPTTRLRPAIDPSGHSLFHLQLAPSFLFPYMRGRPAGGLRSRQPG